MEDDHHLAAGLDLLLSAKLDACEAYFNAAITAAAAATTTVGKKTAHHARSAFGLALVAVIRALMSFQPDDIAQGEKRLAAVLQLASPSWTQTLLGSTASLEALDLELVGADALLFSALLHFMNETSLDFLKGALAIRKAHKLYQRAEHEVQRRGLASAPSPRQPGRGSASGLDVMFDGGDAFFDAVESTAVDARLLVRKGTSVEDRVRGAASLGVGLYGLVFSFIPPRFQGVASTLGFGSAGCSRQASLAHLRACVQSGTARAPVASLVLLIFHSAMLIFARGVSDEADTVEAAAVLDLCVRQYPESPLFRFFQGRLERGHSRLGFALDAYALAQQRCGDVPAMHDLCTYERAFCLTLQGEYGSAAGLFATLARQSPWSPCFYGYLAGAAYFSHATDVVLRHGAHPEASAFGDSLQAAVEGRRPPLEEARVAMLSAARWFKAVPAAVQKRHGRTIPPEAFAEARAAAFNARADAVFGPGAPSAEVALKSTATWAQLEALSRALCLPTLEVALFWNGFFQMSPRARAAALDTMTQAAQLLRGDGDAWTRTHEPTLQLMRAAMLRECGRVREAEAELDFFVGKEALWQRHFATFERGLCRYVQGDVRGAVAAWASVGDSGFFFDARLKFRVRSAMAMVDAKSA